MFSKSFLLEIRTSYKLRNFELNPIPGQHVVRNRVRWLERPCDGTSPQEDGYHSTEVSREVVVEGMGEDEA